MEWREVKIDAKEFVKSVTRQDEPAFLNEAERQTAIATSQIAAAATAVSETVPDSLIETRRDLQAVYHRRPMCWCILEPGETEGGGLAMVMPVKGLMIGMALRARVAAGW